MLKRFTLVLVLVLAFFSFASNAVGKEFAPKRAHSILQDIDRDFNSKNYEPNLVDKVTLADFLLFYRYDSGDSVYKTIAAKSLESEVFCRATAAGLDNYQEKANVKPHMFKNQATPVHVRRVSGFFSNACPAVKLALSEIESASIAHAKNHCPIFELGNCWNKHNNLWARDDITIGLYFDFAETASTSQLLEVCEKGALKQKQISGSELKSRNGKLHPECPYESPFLTQVAFNGN